MQIWHFVYAVVAEILVEFSFFPAAMQQGKVDPFLNTL